MSTAKDLVHLGRLVAATHGWAAAKAFKSYGMSDTDRAGIAACAVRLLDVFPLVPNASALMSAAFAVQLERVLTAPVQVVAGTLCVEGEPVFGDRMPFDGHVIFGSPNPDWHGHVWVMIGPHIADISIFRTAYSRFGPASLSRHIDLVFGPNKALYVDQWQKSRQRGLSYEPQYVLSEEEVTRLMGGAYERIEQARSERAQAGSSSVQSDIA
ncbi:hypothetical protein DM806_10710 [Sphingobium lactosutens]|uniref:hypothetical protein n=1 Tax=Sphingobium lactosutens TaxID=522773 RepID=UPI0015C19BBD|nr:hypothetical protein [Sphingobium lactosutens]NWK96141.1 hypothetical protein [Sphingobium lactosutens]